MHCQTCDEAISVALGQEGIDPVEALVDLSQIILRQGRAGDRCRLFARRGASG